VALKPYLEHDSDVNIEIKSNKNKQIDGLKDQNNVTRAKPEAITTISLPHIRSSHHSARLAY
jgi:hypothetical protein